MKKMDWSKEYFNREFSYEDPWYFHTSKYEQTKYKRQLDLLKKYNSNYENILEIGSAEGAHTRLIAEYFPSANIIGVELSENAINRAKELNLNNALFINSDILTYVNSIQDNSINVIIWSESIYYIGDRLSIPKMVQFVGELSKKLVNAGLLCMANIFNQETGPEEFLTQKPIMEVYFFIIEKYLKPIYCAEFTEFKQESNKKHTYQIWLFQRT